MWQSIVNSDAYWLITAQTPLLFNTSLFLLICRIRFFTLTLSGKPFSVTCEGVVFGSWYIIKSFLEELQEKQSYKKWQGLTSKDCFIGVIHKKMGQEIHACLSKRDFPQPVPSRYFELQIPSSPTILTDSQESWKRKSKTKELQAEGHWAVTSSNNWSVSQPSPLN